MSGFIAMLDAHLMPMICQILARHPQVTSAILFGSRAKGTAHRASDIDLALQGSITALEASAIARELDEELPTLLHFDVHAFEGIDSVAVREHINRVGIRVYQADFNS